MFFCFFLENVRRISLFFEKVTNLAHFIDDFVKNSQTLTTGITQEINSPAVSLVNCGLAMSVGHSPVVWDYGLRFRDPSVVSWPIRPNI